MVSKQIRCWPLETPVVSGIHFNKQTDPPLIAIRYRHGPVRQQSAVHTPAHLAAGLLLAGIWALKHSVFQLSTFNFDNKCKTSRTPLYTGKN